MSYKTDYKIEGFFEYVVPPLEGFWWQDEQHPVDGEVRTDQAGRRAKELSFVRDTFEKVCRLADILSFMESAALLSDTLALKGGTASNLTIFDLPRLSVDIDMDYSKDVPKEAMLQEREQIKDRIRKYMTASGYSLSPKSKQDHALDSFVFEYVNAGGMKDNLKIEINYMLRCHVFPASPRTACLFTC